MKQKNFVILIVLCLTFLTIGCTDKDQKCVDKDSSATVVAPSYPHEVTFKTLQGRTFEISSPSVVSTGNMTDSPKTLLNASNNNWYFLGSDGIYTVLLLSDDIYNIPDINITTPTKEDVWLRNFNATSNTDSTGREFITLTWEQQGLKTVSIDYLKKQEYEQDYQTYGLYNGNANEVSAVIYKTSLVEGEMWLIRTSGELNF